jgi:protein-disulfide isomerase
LKNSGVEKGVFMKKLIWLLVLGLVVTAPVVAAPLDVSLIRSVSTSAPVRQAAATADGQRFYLLLDNGMVQLHDQDGQLRGSFDAGPDVIGIVAQGNNRLLMQMKDQQQVLIVALIARVQISTTEAPTHGNQEAPVTIAVFDDFECPYCSRLVAPLKEVLTRYPDRAKLVFKNFPLTMHKHARTAALAGLAAQRQGLFWPLHDLMFANYRQLNPDKIKELAQTLGLDMARFEQDLKDPELARKVDADIEEGKKVGVQGTPTLFINGRRVQQRTVAAMSKMIDEELDRLGKKAVQ